MGTCVRAGGAVRVSRTEFSFRSRWTGLKDEVPGKSTGRGPGCQTRVVLDLISTILIEHIRRMNWTYGRSLDSLAISPWKSSFTPDQTARAAGESRRSGERRVGK